MTSNPICSWLRRKISAEVAASWGMAVVALLAGLTVLFLTFWLSYAVIYIGARGISAVSELIFGTRIRLAHEWRLVGAGVFLVLLFIGHLRAPPFERGDYPPRNDALLIFHSGAFGPLVQLLAQPRASSKMIADILYTGPRLVTGAWGLSTRAFWLGKANAVACAPVLMLLASRDKAVTWEELSEAFPDATWDRLHPQLRLINGIVYLEKGIALSAELREELGKRIASG